MAELEDSDDDAANEDIGRIQEKCHIAATLMGEWPPLIVPSAAGSPKNRPVLDRILSSKHRLLSLTSSPSPSPVPAVQRSISVTPPSSGSELLKEGQNGSNKVSSDENKLFRKFLPGVKVRDAIFFRKSVERDDEESDKDGFFKRLLRESRDDEESDKEGFFRRLLSKDYEETDKEGFFRRLIRDSKDDEVSDKEWFFRRLIRESKDDEGDLSSPNSDGFFKRLFRDSRSDSDDKMGGLKAVEDDGKEWFFRRIFKEKIEEKKDGHEKVEEDKHEEKMQLGDDDDDDKEGFFRRLFKDRHEEKKGVTVKTGDEEKFGEEEEKDRFFHRFFKEKQEERKDGKEKAEDEERVREDEEKEGFFRRIFKEKQGEKKDGNEKLGEDDEKEGFFHRLFKEKLEEKKDGNAKTDDEEKPGEIDDKDGFFRRLFKEKHEEQKDGSEKTKFEKGNRNCEEEEASDFLPFRRLFRVHPEDVKIVAASEISNDGTSFETSPGSENFFSRMFRDRERALEDSDLYGLKKHKEVSL